MVIGMTSLHGAKQVADTTTTESLPDDGPWSKGWKEVSKAAGNFVQDVSDTVDSVKQSVSSIKMPWESSASELAAQTANDKARVDAAQKLAPIQQQNAPIPFSSLFQRLVGTESNGKHTDASGGLLTSNKGAQGITQVVPKTAQNPGFGVTPIQNDSKEEYLRFGNDYLQALIKNFGGDQKKAVAAYNAGPGAVDRAVAKAAKNGGDFTAYLPAETQKYVQKILGNALAVVTGSSNANAAADFNPYLASNKTETGNTYDGGKWKTQTNAYGAAAVDIIKKDFPEHIDQINTKITAGDASAGAEASYGGSQGDVVNMGKVGGSDTTWTDKNGKPSKSNKPLDSNKTNEVLATMLHEVQHARMDGVNSFNAGIGQDWKKMLDDADKANFPSITSGLADHNGDALNEFLATATTIKEMQRKGYEPTGRYAEPAKQLPIMEKKYPWLKQYIINYIYPEAEASASNRVDVQKARNKK
jgi:hypothetical protein